RHFSSSVGLETLDINQNETPKKKQGFRVLYSLFLMSAPEWPIILFGCLACLGTGLSQMVLSILRAKAANAKCNFSLQMSRVLYACGLMVLFSLIICFTTLLQSVLFSISGCALIKRLRMKAFSSMLRQEVGWFDRSGNNSGALCARLSTDANILQSRAGKQGGNFYDVNSKPEEEARMFVVIQCNQKAPSFTAYELAQFIDKRYYEINDIQKTDSNLIRLTESC
ncbi:unnamed protein product, partial [Rotaria socialis]